MAARRVLGAILALLFGAVVATDVVATDEEHEQPEYLEVLNEPENEGVAGEYKKTSIGEKDGWFCYQQVGDKDMYLCWSGSSSFGWGFQREQDLGTKRSYYVSQPLNKDPSKAGPWFHYRLGEWKDCELQVKSLDEPRKFKPDRPKIFVSGVPHEDGLGDYLNGEYQQSETVKNEQHCFEKADNPKVFFCMSEHGLWVVQTADASGMHTGYLTSDRMSPGVAAPQDVSKWFLWNPETREWEERPGIRVSQWRQAFGSSLSMMALGAFALTVVISSAAQASDPQTRSNVNRLLSSASTIFIAAFIEEMKHEGIFKLSLRTTPRVSVSFALFTAAYGLLGVLGWKVQYSHSRLYGLKTLGGSVVGYLGISAFTGIQEETLQVLPQQLTGSILSAEYADTVTAIGVFGFAWAVLYAYRQATTGLLMDYLKAPPAVPWGTKTTTYLAETRWGCTSPFGATKVTMQDAIPDWVAIVREGEDGAAFLVKSFMLKQLAVYFQMGDVSSLRGSSVMLGDLTLGWWCLVGVLAVGAGILLSVLRTIKFSDSRDLGILANSITLVGSWCLIYIAVLTGEKLYPAPSDGLPEATMTGAFGSSVGAIGLMLALDRLSAGRLPGVLPEAAARQQLLAMFFGNAIGFSWAKTYQYSYRGFADETMLAEMPMNSGDLVLSLSIMAGALWVWWSKILPKAEMTEPAHSKLIELEQELAGYPNAFS